ncbi:MAG: metallophosphoesterase [Helicobacteraceae bacterium]|jgi:predicted MPP superfamily phosphohydrolase|nr:metallophosphoesterase [Helicobacteraceae bacterium]
MSLTIISLFLLVLSAWYVPFSLKKLLGFKKTVLPAQAAIFVLMAGYCGMLIAGIYTLANPAVAAAYNILGLFLIFQLYLFFYLLVVWILRPLLKKVSDKGIAAFGLLLCIGLVGFGFVRAQTFTVTKRQISVHNLARPVTIMHIPDLHLGAQRSEAYLKKVIAAIQQYNPDLVLYNGDLVDSNIALREELFALFKNVEAEQYFTTGNHEFYLNTDKALKLIKNAGIRILHSELVETHGLQLIGMDYMNADRITYDAHVVNNLTIEEELPKIQRSAEFPVILAHHSPVGMQYASQGNIDVMLAGHTHGGQVFPGAVIIGLRFPMNKGRYQIDSTTLLVSQGAGTFGPWMRLGTFNELQFITLVPAE